MDNSFSTALPYLKLRHESPIPWLTSLIVALVVCLICGWILFSLYRAYRNRRRLWQTFLENSQQRGLNHNQRRLLLHIARRAHMAHPLLLLNSLNAFDKYAGHYAAQQARGNSPSNKENLTVVSQIRTVLGFDQLAPNQPMSTTRELEPGLVVLVWPNNEHIDHFIQCVVLKRDDGTITVAAQFTRDTRHLESLQVNDKVKVSFWREGHTEYHFHTRILGLMPSANAIILQHSERLERVQKRHFFRLEIKFNLVLYWATQRSDGDVQIEDYPIKGQVTDISGGGFGFHTEDVVEPGSILAIDPEFVGPFLPAGLICKVVHQAKQLHDYHLRIEFVDLQPHQERVIIRAIYQWQLDAARDITHAPQAANGQSTITTL